MSFISASSLFLSNDNYCRDMRETDSILSSLPLSLNKITRKFGHIRIIC